jgi:hypothetical protein
MSNEARRALEMKEQLEDKQREVDRLEGEITQLKRQMKDQHGCSTVSLANKKLSKSATTIENMKAKRTEGLQGLEEG